MAARSTHVSISNMAGRFNLRRTAMSLEHGEWTNQPPLLIGNRGDWESESNGFATGTEGHVTYQIEDDEARRIGELRLHWDNPFVGSNSYDESVAPAAASATDAGFSIVHSGGGGDNASVTFTLLNAFCTIDPQEGIVCSSASPVTDADPDARARFAAIWSRGVGTTWHAVHDLGSAQYQQKFDELVGQGFRLVNVSGYGVGGQDRYAAIFSQDGGPPFAARHGLTNAQYQQTFDELTGQGFRLVNVNGYLVGGQDRYAAIFEQDGGPGFAARHGLTSAQYQRTFDELLGQGLRLVQVCGYGDG